MKIKKILNILNPQPQIGGLEISDSDIRFFLVKGKSFVSASVKLPDKKILKPPFPIFIPRLFQNPRKKFISF